MKYYGQSADIIPESYKANRFVGFFKGNINIKGKRVVTILVNINGKYFGYSL